MTTTPLGRLEKIRDHLHSARAEAVAAAGQLSGARAGRADELAEKLADVIAHCERLLFVVLGDLRAEQHFVTTDRGIFDVGPTPPPWVLPGAQPAWDSLTDDGASVLSWVRELGAVWIACDDTIQGGRWVRSPAAICFCEPRGGLDAAGARRLAAELLGAAAKLDPPA